MVLLSIPSSVLLPPLTPSCQSYNFIFLTYMHFLYLLVAGRVSPVPNYTFHTYRFPYTEGFFDGAPVSFHRPWFSPIFPRLNSLFPSFWKTYFNDTAEFTLCYGLHDCSPCYYRYFTLSLSTLHYCNAPRLATQLTGDYWDGTSTR